MEAAVCYNDYSPHGRQETGMRQRAERHNPSNAAASELLTHSRHIKSSTCKPMRTFNVYFIKLSVIL